MTDPTIAAPPSLEEVVSTARDAVERGYTPIPIRAHSKRPAGSGWQHTRWADADEAHERIADAYRDDGFTNLSVLLGEPSSGLVDVDFDHPKVSRLKDMFLPRTPMVTGRATRPRSHYWYRIAEGTALPTTRAYKLLNGETTIELRSTGAQTVIPPSQHPLPSDPAPGDGMPYRWEGEPWGGEAGPLEVDGRVLAVQVALIGLCTAIVDAWPSRGSRHDAYLALAGGLLRYGDEVHPYWEQNARIVIRAVAEASLDDDGPDAREHEAIESTIRRLRSGRKAVGFGRLAEIIPLEQVQHIRRLIDEVESLAGFQSRNAPVPAPSPALPPTAAPTETADEAAVGDPADSGPIDDEDTRPVEFDPLGEREVTWQRVKLGPYLTGQVVTVDPSVLLRSDGAALIYPGRVNMLYGSSESAKSWIALMTCVQELAHGERTCFIDLEDDPASTVGRMLALGADPDDLERSFMYYHPEEPLPPMMRNRWGDHVAPSDRAVRAFEVFQAELEAMDPSLVIVDGMTVLYGLHGLDTNDAVNTDVITGWLKSLTRNGRRTVIIIDHTIKNAEKGSLPLGSQHKVAMVQGAMLQVWPVTQPMPGAVGEVELVVLKDRPGKVRAVSAAPNGKAQVSAVVTMDSTTPGQTRMRIDPPRSAPAAPAGSVKVPASQSREAERAQRALDLDLRAVEIVADDPTPPSPDELRALLMADGMTTANAANRSLERCRERGWLDRVPAQDGRRGQGRVYVLGASAPTNGLDGLNAITLVDDLAGDDSADGVTDNP